MHICRLFISIICSNTLRIGSNKVTVMTMLVICQDPAIRQLAEVIILIFTVEEMAVQTLEMSI